MSQTQTRRYPGSNDASRTGFAPYSAFDIPADLRELSGQWDVNSTALRLRNYRYAEEWTMMMLGGWLATCPEIPIKTGLGKVIWETAQAADVLGKRLPELRCGRNPAEASRVANQGFAEVVQAIAEPERPEQSIEKLTGVFDVLKPHLIAAYEANIHATDPIADAPTIEILEDIVRKTRRNVAWGGEVLDRLCDTDAKREIRRGRRRELEALLKECGGVTGEGDREAPDH